MAGIVWAGGSSRLLRFRPHECEVTDVLTLPQYRGHGIARALVAAACVALQQAGYVRAYALIEISNLVSQKVFRAVGFEMLAERTVRPLFMRLIPTEALGPAKGREEKLSRLGTSSGS